MTNNAQDDRYRCDSCRWVVMPDRRRIFVRCRKVEYHRGKHEMYVGAGEALVSIRWGEGGTDAAE